MIKNFFKERKNYREQMKKMKKEEEELEKELEKEIPKEKISLLDLIFDSDEPEEQELYQYLTDSEKQELEELKKSSKRITITAISTLGGIVALGFVGLFIFSILIKSDLEKITKPIMQEYYNNTYGEKVKIKELYNICPKEGECSDIAIGLTDSNTRLVAKNNELLGDDSGAKTKIVNEYKTYIKSALATSGLISHNPELSYKPYYLTYQYYDENINVMPANKSFEELLNTKQLTIVDTLIYQGIFNYNVIKDLLLKLSKDSKFYIIEQENGLPISLTVAKKGSITKFPITGSVEQYEGITTYQTNRLTNSVNSISVNPITSNDVQTEGDIVANTPYTIAIEKDRPKQDEPELPSYYLIRFKNNTFSINNKNNVLLFSYNSNSSYSRPYEISEYPELVSINIGGYTYVISNTSIGIATKGRNNSLLCRLNLC